MRKWSFATLLLSIMLPFTVVAQSADGWNMVLYVETRDGGAINGSLVTITTEGMTDFVALPPEIYPSGDIAVRQVEVSPDNRFVALSMQIQDADSAPPVAIADLENGTCCTLIEMDVPMPAAYQLAGFDLTSTQVALSYVGFDPSVPDVYAVGGLMIADAETGDVIQAFEMQDIAPELEYAPWALMGNWTDEGIAFIPSCYGCEPPFEGEWWLWQPEAAVPFNPSSGTYFSAFGITLPATRALLLFSQNQLYPYSAREGMFPAANVIQYYADGVLPATDLRGGFPVVYFNIDNYDLDNSAIHWVNDGEGFIVASPTQTNWIVTSRVGGQRFMTVPLGSRVLGGTPNGWINLEPTADPTMFQLIHYRLTSGEYIPEDFGVLNGEVIVARAATLGASLGEAPAPFVVIDPPIVGDVFPDGSAGSSGVGDVGGFICDGVSVPPRLVINNSARVTPGAPNNIRSSPTTNSPVIGSIPGDGVFTVLEGPVCNQTFVWWYVDYLGTRGYTVESADDQYFVEPL